MRLCSSCVYNLASLLVLYLVLYLVRFLHPLVDFWQGFLRRRRRVRRVRRRVRLRVRYSNLRQRRPHRPVPCRIAPAQSCKSSHPTEARRVPPPPPLHRSEPLRPRPRPRLIF